MATIKEELLRGFLTVEEVAAQFSVSPRTLQRWVDLGIFPGPIKVHSRWARWAPQQLTDFIEQKTAQATLQISHLKDRRA